MDSCLRRNDIGVRVVIPHLMRNLEINQGDKTMNSLILYILSRNSKKNKGGSVDPRTSS